MITRGFTSFHLDKIKILESLDLPRNDFREEFYMRLKLAGNTGEVVVSNSGLVSSRNILKFKKILKNNFVFMLLSAPVE